MRTLIVGAAVSGMAAARLGRRLGHSVTIYDQDPTRAATIIGAGFPALVGAWDVTSLAGIDLVVASPGVPERSEPFTHATEMGIPVWSEIEFAWQQLDCRTVAVTGTNGKTTVTTLVAEMLTASFPATAALGNIGQPLSDAVDTGLDTAVIEVSSFQLRFTERFRPDVAVVTNVAPDHLDWHGSFDRYLAAKAEIVARQKPEDVLVFDGDDPGAHRIARVAPGITVEVSGTRRLEGGGVENGMWWIGDDGVAIGELGVSDPAFLADLTLAGAAALRAGARLDDIHTVARGFRPGAHRRSLVGEWDGVRYVNDSKATNPHAALAAIRSFPSVILIAGGLAKGLDISPLATEPNVRHVVAIGEAAGQLQSARPDVTTVASSMEEAVRLSQGLARAGDTVLLAPGCASFDMFADYAARGDAFSSLVRAIMGEMEGSP
jgi:UDP-N-acetylmuramoylalanine--D-glutamate ligase